MRVSFLISCGCLSLASLRDNYYWDKAGCKHNFRSRLKHKTSLSIISQTCFELALLVNKYVTIKLSFKPALLDVCVYLLCLRLEENQQISNLFCQPCSNKGQGMIQSGTKAKGRTHFTNSAEIHLVPAKVNSGMH